MSESAITWWANLSLDPEQSSKANEAYAAAIECLNKVSSKDVNMLLRNSTSR
jgi:hypothetical protein